MPSPLSNPNVLVVDTSVIAPTVADGEPDGIRYRATSVYRGRQLRGTWIYWASRICG